MIWLNKSLLLYVHYYDAMQYVCSHLSTDDNDVDCDDKYIPFKMACYGAIYEMRNVKINVTQFSNAVKNVENW